MAALNKEIEVIVSFTKEGKMRPQRFRLTDEEGVEQVFKVEKVISQDNEKVFSGMSVKFVCQVNVHDVMKICEIRFIKESMTWRLEKLS